MAFKILILGLLASSLLQGSTRPNIVLFILDDIGTGDVAALSMSCRIRTPYLDGFTSEGMRLTDFHSSSAQSTPTHYALLTGRYGWRAVPPGKFSPLGKGSDDQRPTVAALLRDSGYRTAYIGNWTLGLGWPTGADGKSDTAQPFLDGPLARGFETFFGLASDSAQTLGPWLEGNTRGPQLPQPHPEILLSKLTERTLTELRKTRDDPRPFFMVIALPTAAAGVKPSAAWRGRSSMHPYADLVMEIDHSVGRILMALRETQRAEDALVIITSDNGTSRDSGRVELAEFGHFSSAGFRGYKGDLYEGGHRVPALFRWPKRIERGATSSALATSSDIYATLLQAAGVALPTTKLGGEDSVSLLPVLLGQKSSVRHDVVHHAGDREFAFRQGSDKLILSPAPNAAASALPYQWFDLEADPAEQTDLARLKGDEAETLRSALLLKVKAGRTTPGVESLNDHKVIVGGGR